MTYYKKEWLPHLQGAIPPEARRNRTSLYTIALEGWRRGLGLKFYRYTDHLGKKDVRYSLSNKSKTHYFKGSNGDLNTQQAFEICDDKGLTAKYLDKNQIPIPKGSMFTIDTPIDEILAFTKSIKYPIVVKPTDGSGGKGVFANIKNDNELITAIEFMKKKHTFNEIIVQQYAVGEEIRVYVLEEQVLAAANRLPANVVGDGKHTIIQLIRNKNEIRKNVPHLYYRPIKIDAQVRELIEKENFTLDSVLPKNRRLYLRKISNVSTGGDPVDITNDLTQEQHNIAVNATKAIPGLRHSGVDIIINQETGNTVVLEVNTRPGIGSHLFPIEGNATDIPKKLIDYYFPETKNNYLANEYFDLQIALDSLNSEVMDEIEIVPAPINKLTARKYVVHCKLDLIEFYGNVKKHIMAHKIQGMIKSTIDQTGIEIIAAHADSKELDEFQMFLEERNHLLKISDIQEKPYMKPIKMGFHIADGLRSMSFLELRNKYNQIVKEKVITEKEVMRLNHRINLMKKSRAWKLTAPLRFVTKVLKRKNY